MSDKNGTKPPTLLGLLESATAADLAEINQQIAALEGERDTIVAGFDKRLTSLRGCRKVIDLKVNGPKARKKPVRKARAPGESPAVSSAEAQGKRLRIAQLLGDKMMLSTQIAQRLGFPDARAVGQLLQCDWFERTSSGVRLTDKGRREAGV